MGTFDVATVAMKRVETAVVAGRTGRALDLAREVPNNGIPTSNNRNRHLLDVAFAQLDHKRYGEAWATLLRIRQDAPSWLAHQRFAREIVGELVAARRQKPSDELAELANLVRVDL